MTTPTPTEAELDQAVIDAAKALVDALAADPLDPAAVATATQALHDARAARGYV